MQIHRGDIFYVNILECDTVGCEQKGRRPALIVSNERNNEHSQVVEVVYLTTQRKKYLPTHVYARIRGIPSTILCEQVTSISVERLESFITKVPDWIMQKVDRALMISLELPEVLEFETIWALKESVRSFNRELKEKDKELEWYKDYYEKTIGQEVTYGCI